MLTRPPPHATTFAWHGSTAVSLPSRACGPGQVKTEGPHVIPPRTLSTGQASTIAAAAPHVLLLAEWRGDRFTTIQPERIQCSGAAQGSRGAPPLTAASAASGWHARGGGEMGRHTPHSLTCGSDGCGTSTSVGNKGDARGCKRVHGRCGGTRSDRDVSLGTGGATVDKRGGRGPCNTT